ncbi:hypothetical protein J6590_030076 [Homalodisca vitripennis]|nr:hypothetical protein J6590_030076 [Homalodisca vitripennis]
MSTLKIKRSSTAASQQGWTPQGYSGPLAMPEVRPDGTLVDTSEVIAARAAHLAALEAARASNPDMDNGKYDPHKYGDDKYGVVSHLEDLMKTALLYKSQIKGDYSGTKAVAEAAHDVWKTTNGAALSTTGAVYGSPQEQNKPYSGPLAMLQVLDSGYLADTPEVNTARNIHLKALAEALAAKNPWKTKNTHHQPWN